MNENTTNNVTINPTPVAVVMPNPSTVPVPVAQNVTNVIPKTQVASVADFLSMAKSASDMPSITENKTKVSIMDIAKSYPTIHIIDFITYKKIFDGVETDNSIIVIAENPNVFCYGNAIITRALNTILDKSGMKSYEISELLKAQGGLPCNLELTSSKNGNTYVNAKFE